MHLRNLNRPQQHIIFQLKEQARESESDRRKLEKARQEVFHHMTKIKNEKENLEREVLS